MRIIFTNLTKHQTFMKKKFICTVCGYIHEGTEAPERCPICKAPASKFNEVVEGEEQPFATVHELGAARKEGADEEMIKDLMASVAR